MATFNNASTLGFSDTAVESAPSTEFFVEEIDDVVIPFIGKMDALNFIDIFFAGVFL